MVTRTSTRRDQSKQPEQPKRIARAVASANGVAQPAAPKTAKAKTASPARGRKTPDAKTGVPGKSAKPSSGHADSSTIDEPQQGPWPTPPRTMEERLERIELMAQRINNYVRFMCQIGTFHDTSKEAKERLVSDFYDRMAIVATQLGRIHDELWLG